MVDIKKSWKYRAIKHLDVNETETGALLLAILGIVPPRGPRFDVMGCIIAKDGNVIAAMRNRHGRDSIHIINNSPQDFRDRWRRLADELLFEDWERRELFREVKQWVRQDCRVISDLGGW